jgi:hypothetical protein
MIGSAMGQVYGGEYMPNWHLQIHPVFIPHRFWILEFGFMVFCQFNKNDRAKRYNQSLRGVGH